MIVLDTNVLSEIFRPEPAAEVVAWLESLTGEVTITAITLAVLLAGLQRLPDGRRMSTLSAQIALAVEPYRGDGSVLAFDDSAAEQYAEVLAAREAAGLPISTADAQIAAICRAHAATCATRNTKDFSHTGVEVVNPWAA